MRREPKPLESGPRHTMRISRFFIDRPIFAAVVALVITIIGAIGYIGARHHAAARDHAADHHRSRASYPGASAQTVADTVAAPIEQEVNGVEGMIYMASQSTGDGNLSLTVTFDVGTDIDKAQVLVQNRVSAAERAPARRGAPQRAHRAQALARPAARRPPDLAATTPTTRSTSPTTACSTCATS